jgi:GT2 family glycosyltransferase
VLATNRAPTTLPTFLDALAAQTVSDHVLVVVDQSRDGEVERVLARYAQRLRVLRTTSSRGLSRGRNEGLRELERRGLRSEVVAFPDDDCWYPPELLERVLECLERRPDLAGVTGRTVDARGAPSSARWDPRGGRVQPGNIWSRGVEAAMFLRHDVVRSVGPFDEGLGLGSPSGAHAGEGTDYLLRALAAGGAIEYVPDLVVYHPEEAAEGARDVERAYGYGRGIGSVLRKHRGPVPVTIRLLLRPLGGAILSVLRRDIGRAEYYWASFRGRISGLRRPG